MKTKFLHVEKLSLNIDNHNLLIIKQQCDITNILQLAKNISDHNYDFNLIVMEKFRLHNTKHWRSFKRENFRKKTGMVQIFILSKPNTTAIIKFQLKNLQNAEPSKQI